jgi:mono/diheme cytochrome c family protein
MASTVLPTIVGLVALTLATTGAARATEDNSLVERGAYLVNGIMACGNCHTPKGPIGDLPSMEMAGGMKFDDEAFTAYATNITMDAQTGLGSWTDEDIIAALREGRRPDGTVVGPPHPTAFYRIMADADALAVVAYLRSLPPVRNAVPKSEYRIALPKPYGAPLESVPEVPREDRVAYGGYLASIGHCMECHTPMDGHPDRMRRMGAGGPEFTGPWGTSIGSDITMDPVSGIGAWSDDEIKRATVAGTRPNGRRLKPPMPYAAYATMTEGDLEALVAWMRTVAPAVDDMP